MRIDAIEVDPASVEEARRNAQAAGVADRITLHQAVAESAPLTRPYDLVTALECLHDMAYPVKALRRMRDLAAPDGAVLVADEAVGDSLEENPVVTLPARADERRVGKWTLSSTLVTMAEALLAGAGSVLELDPRELQAFVRRRGDESADDQIVIYETAPGGAGYVSEADAGAASGG